MSEAANETKIEEEVASSPCEVCGFAASAVCAAHIPNSPLLPSAVGLKLQTFQQKQTLQSEAASQRRLLSCGVSTVPCMKLVCGCCVAGEGEPHFAHQRFAVYGHTASAGAEALLSAAGRAAEILEMREKDAAELMTSKHLQAEVRRIPSRRGILRKRAPSRERPGALPPRLPFFCEGVGFRVFKTKAAPFLSRQCASAKISGGRRFEE